MSRHLNLIHTLLALTVAANAWGLDIRLNRGDDAREALKAAQASGASKVTIRVEPGVYWLDDPDDPAVRVGAPGSVPWGAEVAVDTLEIIGLADNPEDVVFAVNRGQTQGALGNYTMIHFTGRSLTVRNMTFGNYCNADLVYPADPSLSRPRRKDAIVQAQLGICTDTDRLLADNCRFISRLNLCPFVGARRSLYHNCYFECTDDALSGSAVYLGCRFTFFSGKPFYSTASTGAVFLDCDIHSLTDGVQYFTKAPGAVTVIDTRFTSDAPDLRLQWTRDDSDIRCYQSNVTLNGHPVSIDADRPWLSADITNLPLMRAYKTTSGHYNTPNLLAGDDGWDPLGLLSEIGGEDYLNLPVTLALSVDNGSPEAKGTPVTFTATPMRWGGYAMQGGHTVWNFGEGLVQSADGKATTDNNTPEQVTARVSAATPEGLIASASLKLPPYLTAAPGFSKTPHIIYNKDEAALKAEYTLNAEGDDESEIVWSRVAGGVAHPVLHGTATYPLTAADRGCGVMATVTPKLHTTFEGRAETAELKGTVTDDMLRGLPAEQTEVMTSFAEIPVVRRTDRLPGMWCFDTYKPAETAMHDWEADTLSAGWYYGRGADAATGLGLVQSVKGARLTYKPVREGCRGMKASLIAEPCKGPGQGFGSATGQYLDICLKFDAATLTGYALRIERTPDYDKAVTFTLVSYADGAVTPISEPVPTSCFRTPCHIEVSLTDGILSASARTGAKEVTPSDPQILPEVNLQAQVGDTLTHAGFCIQHTGSTGASATLLRDFKINWE